MSRIASVFAALIAFFFYGCGPSVPVTSVTQNDPSDPIVVVKLELTTQACAQFQPVRSADVTYEFAGCIRYLVPYTAYTAVIYHVPPPAGAPGPIKAVRTGGVAAAWVCSTATPAGVTQSPYAPCWVTQNNDGVVARVRGPYVNGAYQGQSAVIGAGGTGRSIVLSEGMLPYPPWCGYTNTPPTGPTPTHYHVCNLDADAPVAGEVKANNDPADGDQCCNVSGTRPDGTSGAPCLTNVAPNLGYATVHYPPCPLH